ncbi:MAG: response regulator [Pseudomonadota bacterium]|nr:response regulator [Pseudomonadota bacterium]
MGVLGAVLIVDDDDWVRFSSRRLIEGMRRTVLEAVEGVDALAVYRKHAAEIAFVLLDLRMPRMDGAEALRELVRLDPDVRVILSGGTPISNATTYMTCFWDRKRPESGNAASLRERQGNPGRHRT